MELRSIDELELYVDREIEGKNGENEFKRVKLDGDLEVGEEGYFRTGYRNKVIKQGSDEYIFYRFDEIQTHIEDYESGYTFDDVGEVFTSGLDYGLKYSSDRVEQLKGLIEDNEWIYGLLSENRTILKDQKKKNSFLAENQKLDSYFQRMIDFIVHPKFNSEEEEQYYNGLDSEYKELRSKNSKTNSEIIEMMRLGEEVSLLNEGIITQNREKRNKKRESFAENFVALEEDNKSVGGEFTTDKSSLSHKKLQIDEGYWKRMGFSRESERFRKDVLFEYERSLEILVKQLGHGLPREEKEQRQKSLINGLPPLRYNNGKRDITITPEARFNRLGKMYSELKSDYNKAKEILATVVSFNQIDPCFPKYDFNNDTRYTDTNGEVVELSTNMLLFSEPETYRGLILNYYDLKEKYHDKFEDDMWYILLYFEELLRKSRLSEEERFVAELAMQDDNRHEIMESFEFKFGRVVNMRSLNTIINKTIPNKMLNTHLKSVDNWVYTFKIRGKFKQCRKCGEFKLAIDNRYFGKKADEKDGLHSQCKQCRQK